MVTMGRGSLRSAGLVAAWLAVLVGGGLLAQTPPRTYNNGPWSPTVTVYTQPNCASSSQYAILAACLATNSESPTCQNTTFNGNNCTSNGVGSVGGDNTPMLYVMCPFSMDPDSSEIVYSYEIDSRTVAFIGDQNGDVTAWLTWQPPPASAQNPSPLAYPRSPLASCQNLPAPVTLASGVVPMISVEECPDYLYGFINNNYGAFQKNFGNEGFFDGWFGPWGGQAAIPNYQYCNLAGMDLSNTQIFTPQFFASAFGADLSDTNLTGQDLTGLPMANVLLNGAVLDGANLSGLTYTGTVSPLSNSNDQITSLVGTNLSGSNLLQNVVLTGANLSGANLAGATLTGAIFGCNTPNHCANLSGTNLTGLDLSSFNLSNLNLSGATLTGATICNTSTNQCANLGGANLSNLNLAGFNLVGANLVGANLSGSNLTGLDLSTFNLSNVNLTGATLTGVTICNTSTGRCANLSGANLTGVDFSNMNLAGANFAGANLTNASLNSVTAPGAIFGGSDTSQGAILNGANFSFANLPGATFQNANLGPNASTNTGPANLAYAYLAGTNFQGATLTSVDMTGVIMSLGTNLTGATLTSANLGGANLSAVDFSQVKNLQGATLTNANLAEAILSNADFSPVNANASQYAKLDNAWLCGATLDLTNFSGASLQSAIVNISPGSVTLSTGAGTAPCPSSSANSSFDPTTTGNSGSTATICPDGSNGPCVVPSSLTNACVIAAQPAGCQTTQWTAGDMNFVPCCSNGATTCPAKMRTGSPCTTDCNCTSNSCQGGYCSANSDAAAAGPLIHSSAHKPSPHEKP